MSLFLHPVRCLYVRYSCLHYLFLSDRSFSVHVSRAGRHLMFGLVLLVGCYLYFALWVSSGSWASKVINRVVNSNLWSESRSKVLIPRTQVASQTYTCIKLQPFQRSANPFVQHILILLCKGAANVCARYAIAARNLLLPSASNLHPGYRPSPSPCMELRVCMGKFRRLSAEPICASSPFPQP